ncbi:hypothetical protein ACS53_03580 [Bacillus cereus]|nr:hypothetical protein ACS53_03580 [Bacillus cereus]
MFSCYLFYIFLRGCSLFHIEFKIRKFILRLVEVYGIRTKEYLLFVLNINIHLKTSIFHKTKYIVSW